MNSWKTVSHVNTTTHNSSISAGILERYVASGLKELQSCLVLKKSHNKNFLVPICSAHANKLKISYIYNTAGKMLKQGLHQPVKWLRHRQEFENGSPNIIFPYQC